MTGDLRDRESLDAAVTAWNTVVSTVTRIGRLLAGGERGSLEEVDGDGHQNLIAGAEQSGVQRFVFVSAAGIEADPRLPLNRAKIAVEERLRRSPLREVIVRPDAYQEVWISPAAQLDWDAGKLNVLGKGDTPTRYVSVEDVAEAVVRLTLADDPPRTVELSGPEALTRNELCDLIEAAAGRPMKRRHLPRPALLVTRR